MMVVCKNGFVKSLGFPINPTKKTYVYCIKISTNSTKCPILPRKKEPLGSFSFLKPERVQGYEFIVHSRNVFTLNDEH